MRKKEHTLLICDDEPDLLELYAAMLSDDYKIMKAIFRRGMYQKVYRDERKNGRYHRHSIGFQNWRGDRRQGSTRYKRNKRCKNYIDISLRN